jgi:hypothetical protein
MARAKYRLFELLEVEWQDAVGHFEQMSLEDAKKKKLVTRKTVGYFIQETEEFLAIAGTFDGPLEVAEVTVIPLAWSVTVRRLAARET